MKTLLSATMLTCVLTFAAAGATAKTTYANDKDSAVIKASYSLPREDGDTFRQTLHEADEENLQTTQQINLDHADLYDILTAPNFDRNAFRAKLDDVRKLQAQVKQNHDDALSAAVAELTPDERVTLADALEVNPKFSGKHAHHPKHVSTSSNDDQIQNAEPSAGDDNAQ